MLFQNKNVPSTSDDIQKFSFGVLKSNIIHFHEWSLWKSQFLPYVDFLVCFLPKKTDLFNEFFNFDSSRLLMRLSVCAFCFEWCSFPVVFWLHHHGAEEEVALTPFYWIIMQFVTSLHCFRRTSVIFWSVSLLRLKISNFFSQTRRDFGCRQQPADFPSPQWSAANIFLSLLKRLRAFLTQQLSTR